MIISCEHCNKKFEVETSLIPVNGRLLQCSACNHKWFFKPMITESNVSKPFKLQEIDVVEDKKISEIQSHEEKKQEEEQSISLNQSENKKANILNIILVFIISIVAFVIIIDTFKSPISILVPNIGNILNSLYETLTDVFLFIKDLI